MKLLKKLKYKKELHRLKRREQNILCIFKDRPRAQLSKFYKNELESVTKEIKELEEYIKRGYKTTED